MRNRIILLCTGLAALLGLLLIPLAKSSPKTSSNDTVAFAPADLSTSASFTPDLAPADPSSFAIEPTGSATAGSKLGTTATTAPAPAARTAAAKLTAQGGESSGVAFSLVVTTNPTTFQPNQTGTAIATVKDSGNSPVSGVKVTFSATNGFTFTALNTCTTASNGACSVGVKAPATVNQAGMISAVGGPSGSTNVSTNSGSGAGGGGTASGTGPSYGGNGACVIAQLKEFQEYYGDLQTYFSALFAEGQDGPATAAAYQRLQADWQANQVRVNAACSAPGGGGLGAVTPGV